MRLLRQLGLHRILIPTLVMLILLAMVGGTMAVVADTTLLINEVDADQDSTDTAEFIELYDGGSGNMSLDGYVLVLVNGSDNASYAAFDLDGYSTGVDGYFVLCGNDTTVANCDWDVAPDTNLIQNGADAVALYVGDGADFSEDTPVTSTNLVDAIVYDTFDDDDAELIDVLLNPGQPQVNEGGRDDKDSHSNQRCPNGEGGQRNTASYSQYTPTPGAENTCQDLLPFLINEVDADQAGTDNAEFVELHDGGNGNLSLDGYVLVFFNGSNNTSYAAFELDNFSTDADGYFVLCGDNTTVANCDWDVVPDTNLIQNGADAVALYQGDDSDFPAGTPVTDTNLVDAIVYDTFDDDASTLISVLLNPGQPQVNEGGRDDKDGHSNQRCPNGEGGPRNTTNYDQFPPTPGAENTCGSGLPDFGSCGDAATLIHDIQGSGSESPVNGTQGVIIEGFVVGDFQESGQLGGYFVQEEDNDIDMDATTSEGIFVADTDHAVNPGDVVRVQGDIGEFFDLTRLSNVINFAACPDGGTVTPSTVMLPVSDTSDWEAWEGMAVVLPQELYASDTYNWGRYGEVELSAGSPLWIPTEVAAPGAPAQAIQQENDRRRIQLDDGSTTQNPQPLPPFIGPDNTLRSGDVVSNVHAVLSYAFGVYELHPTAPVTFDRVNQRPSQAPAVGGALQVASFNTLNYFSTIDSGEAICGPAVNQDCRGADSASEFARQEAKIVAAILEMNADIIGLQEIENHAQDEALIALTNALNDQVGADTYRYIATGPIGGDAIKVGLIYQTARVSPVGPYAILDSSVDPTFLDTKNRPVLAQTFALNSSGERLTVAVNHLKSKGSGCEDVADPDTGDGQGNCNGTRTDAALAEAAWLASDPTGSGDPDVLILGDLNSYRQEDPLTALKEAGYVDLIATYAGMDAFSYVYFGQWGSLDHLFASPHLSLQVTSADVWHINADEPRALDYNTFNQEALYQPSPYRSSDHNPLLVGLNLTDKPYVTFFPVQHKAHD